MDQSSHGSDPLMSILSQEKEMFNLNHKDVSPDERTLLWDARVKELSAALIAGESTTQTKGDCIEAVTSTPMARNGTVPPRKRRKSIQLEPLNTQASLQHGPSMSRKRSYQDRVASTPRLHTPRTLSLSRFEDDDEEPFNPYHRANPPKMARTPSGPMPVRHASSNSFSGFCPSEPLLTNTTTSSPYSMERHTSSHMGSPSMPSGSTSFPAMQSSTSSGDKHVFRHHHHHHHHEMARHSSLGGAFYNKLTSMNLTSPADDSRPPPFEIGRSLLPDVFDNEPDEEPFSAELGASAVPIPIPHQAVESQQLRRSSGHVAGSHPHRPSQAPTIREQVSMVSMLDRQSPTNRPLAPRPSAENSASSSLSTPSCLAGVCQVPIKMVDSNGMATEKYQIAKLAPAKKQKEKQFFCEHCDKQPGGFRGAHELQRHFDAQHAKVKRVWICVDGSPNRDKLTGCKACRDSKAYPAYYNAAAHLRRIHFKPKDPGGKKSKTPRAGIGGGKEPPMDELKKYWMRQVALVDGQLVDESEQPDFEVIDEDEINAENVAQVWVEEVESDDVAVTAAVTTTVNVVGAKDRMTSGSVLNEQARLTAENMVPALSTTIESVISSSSDMSGTGIGTDDPKHDPMTASELVAAASVNATGGGSDMHQSFCSVDEMSSFEDGLQMSPQDYDFSDMFHNLDYSWAEDL